MNKQDRLAQVRRMAQDDHDAVTMLLAACADMGNSDGLLLSVKAFDKAAEFILDYLRAETAVPAPAKNALIARCRHCGRAVYASVEVVEHIDDEGPELLELLTAGFDLVYTDVETARGLFGCECASQEAK